MQVQEYLFGEKDERKTCGFCYSMTISISPLVAQPIKLQDLCQSTSWVILIYISIYHTSEQYFLRALIGQVGGDQPSTIHLRAAKEKQNGFCRYIFTNKLLFGPLVIQLVWYILKQLFTSVLVKVVYIYLHFGE